MASLVETTMDRGSALCDAPRWPHQERALRQILAAIEAGERAICVTAPTGSGKSLIQRDLIRVFARQGKKISLYTNRCLLFEQIARQLEEERIPFGRRASGHKPRLLDNIQLTMVQSELSAVGRERRSLHAADVVLVDEAHVNSEGQTLALLQQHLASGAILVGFTATPPGLGHLYKKLIVAASLRECRQVGAILPARVFAPDEPELRWVKRVQVGHEIDGRLAKLYCQMVFGRILEHHKRLNPNRLPALVFGPDVRSSLYLAKLYHNAGYRAAHVDGKQCWVKGNLYAGTDARDQVLRDFESGEIEVLTNRFVMREGIDVRTIYHLVLATVFGSPTTYIQSVGRGLRNHPSLPGHILITDHGGAWHKHGSPNAERDWNLHLRDADMLALRKDRFRNQTEPEPICCPRCNGIRQVGPRCPYCGFMHQRSVRVVLQKDGTLKERSGRIYRNPPAASIDQLALWKKCYHGARKSGRTFSQARGWFFKRSGRWPPSDWPLMPVNAEDMRRRVRDVAKADLVPEK